MLTIAVKAARRAGNVINRGARELDLLTVTSKGPKDFVSEVDREAERAIVETLLASLSRSRDSSRGRHRQRRERRRGKRLDHRSARRHDQLPARLSAVLRVDRARASAARSRRASSTTRSATISSRRRARSRRIPQRSAHPRLEAARICAIASIGTGFPFRDGSYLDTYLRMMKAMIEQTAGLRRPGAAALDLAYVAAGFYDGFWEVGLNPWDVAAGSLLIQEAGGLIGDLGRRRRLPARRAGDRRDTQDLRADGDGARAVSRRPRARALEEAGQPRLNIAPEEPAMPRAVIRIFAVALLFACASTFAQELSDEADPASSCRSRPAVRPTSTRASSARACTGSARPAGRRRRPPGRGLDHRHRMPSRRARPTATRC